MRGWRPQSADSPGARTFPPGALWSRIVRQTRRAIKNGILRRIDTEQRFVSDAGVDFVVRVASSLARKQQQTRVQQARGGERSNPFLPPEPGLLIAAVSGTHFAVLNKFNVLHHHLLIVTRKFEHQETLLNAADLDALWRCLGEYPSLGFYNGGAAAGASQEHKHLQLVPLPLADKGPPVPIVSVVPAGSPGIVRVSAGLPFRHALVNLEPSGANPDSLWSLYTSMLDKVGITAVEHRNGVRQSMPYNLLVTREWMLLVPRSRECFNTISINALGFAGSFFVKHQQQVRIIMRAGPMTALRGVSFVV